MAAEAAVPIEGGPRESSRKLPLSPQASLDTFGNGGPPRRLDSRRPSLLVGARSLELYEKEQAPRFVRFIIDLFRAWGHVVARHPWKAIAFCLILSSLSLIKILLTPQENDVTGYTPYGARANEEWAEYTRFFASHGTPVATYIFAVAKDNGSMLRLQYLDEFIKVLVTATDNFTILNDETGKAENFNEFCKNFCLINEPIKQFHGGMKILNDGASPARIKLLYPISTVFGTSFSLQPNFFGIELYSDEEMEEVEPTPQLLASADNKTETATNETDSHTKPKFPRRKMTNLKMVKMIAMQIRSEQKKGWSDHKVKDYEMRIVQYFMNEYKSDLLQLYVLSQTFVEEEMVRGGKILLPYLTVGFTIMCLCSCITVLIRATYMHQQNFYKIALAITACITPLLATATALSLMFMFGLRFASILCVIPFLVLSIGVDSSYLMIHEWQRVTKHSKERPSRGDSVGRRMGEVLSEVGPAIMISCLTNVFADAVGSFTSSPEITLLCTGNMLSMCIAFIYQMTFYTGLMVLVGRRELSEDDSVTSSMRINIAENTVNMARQPRKTLCRQESKFHEATKPVISEMEHRYVDAMSTPCVSLSVILLYFLYLFMAIWGITRINISLSPQKLFAHDSPLRELDDLRVEHVVPFYSMATVFIKKPGNFSDPARLKRMNEMVRDFERLTGSWGPDGTNYFMRDYETFLISFNDDSDSEDDYEVTDEVQKKPQPLMPTRYSEYDIQHFLHWPEYDFWSGFVHTKNATKDGSIQVLDEFFFTSGFQGKQLVIWRERGRMLQSWRRVVDNYKDFGASVYHEDGVYLDLIDNMTTDTWQSVVGTLICMAGVCFVFLNNLFTVAIASLSVLSICAGILGCISWMGLDLDPISMAAMIISIGFSVDIPAHVSYHYYQASIEYGSSSSPSDRLAVCLSSVAFPAMQAALSTILCVSSLLFVDIYMAEVFVRIMIICVVLCNLHGLVFVPAMLICLDRIRWLCSPKSRIGAAHSNGGRPRISPRHKQNGRPNQSKAPEKSAVPDRPVV